MAGYAASADQAQLIKTSTDRLAGKLFDLHFRQAVIASQGLAHVAPDKLLRPLDRIEPVRCFLAPYFPAESGTRY